MANPETTTGRDLEHLPTCAVGTDEDFGGDCCCAEAIAQIEQDSVKA